MYTKTVTRAWPVLAAVVAGTFFAGDVMGADVVIAYQASPQGLDLSQTAGVHEFYRRIAHAARIVCTHGNRVDLEPAANPNGCADRALADAIRSAHLPVLTQVYLETHTLREAAARGIEVPVQVAAK